MEIRQLEAFRAIAEELHFGRAAQKLYLSQPSISQLLQKLEAELGVLLVFRNSRLVQLTPAGAVFLTETERIFAAIDRGVHLARHAAEAGRGSVRVATNYPASRLLLLPLLERLRTVGSDIGTTLREMGSPSQLAALVRGELDVGLVYGPVDEPGIASAHLLDLPVVALVRAGHPLAHREHLAMRDVLDYPYLTGHLGGSRSIEKRVLEHAASHGVTLAAASDTSDLASHQLVLETTDTIGFSSLTRGQQSEANGLRMLRLQPPEPMLSIHVAWSDATDEPLVNAVVNHLRELAAELGDPA
ncbi:LysR family transcriptional regulator [Conyzicola sp.]|uniref:LysR family transcriptional regulator n=1 Tax=Conyzicola sp. TaxID=1969404 RepID=UPI003988BEE4